MTVENRLAELDDALGDLPALSPETYLHAGRRRAAVHLDDLDPALPAPLPPDARVDLVAAVRRLPAMQRRTVVLRHWLGLTVEETAAELGIREGTVKSHASRGLAALRLTLAEQELTEHR